MKKVTEAPEAIVATVEAPETKKALNKKAKRIAAKKAAKIEAAALLEKSKLAEAAKPKEVPADKNKKKVKDATAIAVVAKITEEKELKYIYPAECQEGGSKEELLEARKKFRAGVRRKVAAFEKTVKNLMGAEKPDKKKLAAAEEEYSTYAKGVYVKGALQTA